MPAVLAEHRPFAIHSTAVGAPSHLQECSASDKTATARQTYRRISERSSVTVTSISRLLAFAALLATGCRSPMVRPAPFRARPDTVKAGDLRGPFQGRVLDAESGRPVSGALVYATWTFVEGVGLPAPAGWREFRGSTDSGGYYKVPQLGELPADGSTRLADFRLVIYKKGFVAYRSDRRFADLGPRGDFSQLRNEVALERWRSDFSHVKHLRYVGGGAELAELTAWEVPEAARELSGQPSALVETGPDLTPLGEVGEPAGPPLDADKLMLPEDVIKATNYNGNFDVRELGDEPSTPEYDSVHLQARDADESYDVALRLWKLPPPDAEPHYEKMKKDLPGVKETNELADRSLRASTGNGDILGVAFLDAKRGVVALIQCGASQCRSHETVLRIARTVKERIEHEIAIPGGAP